MQDLSIDTARTLHRVYDRAKNIKGGMVALAGVITLREARALRELGLIETINAGAGDKAFLTKAGLEALPAASQLIKAGPNQ